MRDLPFIPPGFSLNIPRQAQFGRLDEYCGVWLMEPSRFTAQFQIAQRLDFKSHEQPEPKSDVNLIAGRKGKSVAEIPVTGLLMKQRSSMGGTSTVQLRRDIRQVANDPNVSGILLRIDSPGGTAAGMSDLANEVKVAKRQKPVWAQIEDLGASAAYWLASQANMIFANNSMSQVGSIGTYQVVYDYSAAAEKEGVKTFLFATGPLKGMGTPGTPLTEEQQGHLQGIVDGIQSHFDIAVKSGRGMNSAQLSAVKTGGVFHANHAIDLRLIDGIQSPEKTLNALAGAQ